MKLQRVELRPGQRLLCCRCCKWVGEPIRLADRVEEQPVYADLKGVPFKSYYCAPCAKELS
jgi:hypothetical protein